MHKKPLKKSLDFFSGYLAAEEEKLGEGDGANAAPDHHRRRQQRPVPVDHPSLSISICSPFFPSFSYFFRSLGLLFTLEFLEEHTLSPGKPT